MSSFRFFRAVRALPLQFKTKYLIPIGFVLGTISLGSLGALFTTPAIPTWYDFLNKSPLNPPAWVFGPVWTLLFTLMGISTYLIWKRGIKNENVKNALFIFGIQFLYNIAWSVFFFGIKSPLLGLIDIVILWIFILLTILRFRSLSKLAAYLLYPYLAWVTFATYLNTYILIANPV